MDVQNAAGTEKGRPQMSNGPVNGLVNGHESNDEKVVKEVISSQIQFMDYHAKLHKQ